PDVFAFDFVLVVQCRATDRASADQYRFKHSDWRQNSSASDLNNDVVQTRLHAFRCVFVSDRPARRFRGEPKSFSLRERIDFDYRAVGLIRKIVPDVVQLTYGVENLVY